MLTDENKINVRELADKMNQLVRILEKAAINPKSVNIIFTCSDRSEGTDVICTQIDTIAFDLLKTDVVKIELS